ncbi:hypothetical protein M2396_001728 [Pseudomonas sp. BIGb0278]|jgi:hypothetical protein|uniref:Phage head protein n=1 Tax=Pseudomonas fluorescens TaxID=294 RepID=A0A5E6T6R5_PSEFL|nr:MULTISPECIES: head completion/stabilization protein [Pseudomonas]AUF95855.1 phage head protein [Pseudomonas sp. 02C 26]MCS4283463.1 hypothetical protein [Pseudomonas sp. BIGb0278]QYX53473.1 head completion/stabilization protein [Pseudomonas sp. S07E 245]VVM86483.1 hypothetical protein PS623_02541 [Pseudomonas fluorescens]VVN22011.1 hypothetical protein PS631_04430 [Pseudomonas fluorescens]
MDAELQSPDPAPPLYYLARHDRFWPRIELSSLRQRLAIPAYISDTHLQLAGQQALAIAAGEFASWRRRLRALGYTQLTDLCRHVHGRRLCSCYQRLVEHCTLRALGGRSALQGAAHE